jgi:hypothetical protein
LDLRPDLMTNKEAYQWNCSKTLHNNY